MPALLVAIGLGSLATPFVEPKYYLRWIDFPGLLVAVPMPHFFGPAALTLLWSNGWGRDWMPLRFTLVMFAPTMVGLVLYRKRVVLGKSVSARVGRGVRRSIKKNQ